MTTTTYTRFRKGYRYQLAEDREFIHTPLRPKEDIVTTFIELRTDGTLLTKLGYAWDGRSGLLRRKKTKGPSLFHDAVYQLIRRGHLPPEAKQIADDYYVRLLRKNKVAKWYSGVDGRMLKWFGSKAASEEKEIYEA
jgi:hypothetical protein